MNVNKYLISLDAGCSSIQRTLRGLLLFACVLLAACGGGGGGGGSTVGGPVGSPTQHSPDKASASFAIRDGGDQPISGAVVTLGGGGNKQTATTDAEGIAEFHGLPPGNTPYTVAADGFGSVEGAQIFLDRDEQPNRAVVYLLANDAWATPRLVVLGTQMVEMASDGTELTFTADVAVIDADSEALETLTSAHFSLVQYDCGWGGPRDCASDAAGNDTGRIGFSDGNPIDFALQPPVDRHPYIVEVLVERTSEAQDWSSLKYFFTSIGSNDAASLASVQGEGEAATHSIYGSYTNDPEAFLDAIDQLSATTGGRPSMLDGLVKSIRRVAAAEDPATQNLERFVVVASSSGRGVSAAEVDTVTVIARELGVRVSGVGRDNYGYPEIAVRTGGFDIVIDDPRQRTAVFRAMDQLLAGTMPYYRMSFRIQGEPGAFVSGGNAKVILSVSVPTAIRHAAPSAQLNVAIP